MGGVEDGEEVSVRMKMGEREVDGETVGQIEKGDGGKVECGTWMVPLSP